MGSDKEIADVVRKFIEDMKIHCPEVTCEDRVYQNAPDFVHELCELAGYYEHDDED
jgi:hypothetical protein